MHATERNSTNEEGTGSTDIIVKKRKEEKEEEEEREKKRERNKKKKKKRCEPVFPELYQVFGISYLLRHKATTGTEMGG